MSETSQNTEPSLSFLRERRNYLLERIQEAAKKSARTASGIELLAVSKTVEAPVAALARRAGYRVFGENRAQELKRKLEYFSRAASQPGELLLAERDPAEAVRASASPQQVQVSCASAPQQQVKTSAHQSLLPLSAPTQQSSCSTSTSVNQDQRPVFDMIGNLQSNKIKYVLGTSRLIHSAASEELVCAIDARAQKKGLCQKLLLEVNISGEASKSGFSVAQLTCALPTLLELEHVRIEGLMCMAPAHNVYLAQKSFEGLRLLRDRLVAETGLSLATLSCGMSDDFDLAIQEGSTLVRLGRIVFDPTYQL